MKNLLFLILTMAAVGFSGCAALGSASDWFSGEIRFGLRQGSISPRIAGDTASVVRAYPSSTVKLLPGVDSTYILRSGDRLNLLWRASGEGVLFCDIVADTVSFIRK